jgi:DNA-binding CsgD family transcriptional regulator
MGIPPMTETRKLRVFLCHSSQDKPIVRELYQRLLAEGWIDPWLDEEKLLPGQNFELEIKKAVREADVVIVCLSTTSVSKEGYVQKEIRNALDVSNEKPEDSIFVIPVRFDNVYPPESLKPWQYVDYYPEDRKDWAFQRILKSLEIHTNSGSALRGEAWFKALSKSEVQILLLVSQGLTNKQISEKLQFGEGTVRNYVSSIFDKLKISNRTEAAAYAHKHKLEYLLSKTNNP